LYDATALAHTLNNMRQEPFGTSFKYEDLLEQQKVILAQIQSLEPSMFGHLVAKMIANPSNSVHVSDLSPLKNILDPEHSLLISAGNYPGRDECRAGAKKTMGDCSVGLQQVLRKHNLRLDKGSHILIDAFCASHVYGDVHMQGNVRGDVTQVPHAQLMADVLGAEWDVA